MFKQTTLVLLLSASLACCQKAADTTEKKEEIIECFTPYTLTVPLNNCSQKGDSAAWPLICFTRLDDSRCPADPNINCVWEGVAIGRFFFRINTVQHELTLATKKFPFMPSTDTVVSGVHVRLLSITPHPGTSTEPTRATLQIN